MTVDQTPTSTMNLLTFIYLSLSLMSINCSFGDTIIHSDVLMEGHAIKKRLAELDQEFPIHEIADVLREREPGYFHHISKRDLKSVTESSDDAKRIRLHLSSGSVLHLNLKRQSLFGTDTKFYTNTKKGPVNTATSLEDCYAAGNVEVDGKSDGIATVALCDGLHGSAVSNGVEYYIHPVENWDGLHRVHVLKRPASEFDSTTNNIHAIYPKVQEVLRHKREAVTRETYKNATRFVIELAIFTDAKYNELMKKAAPGREDERVLMNMAGVQALYGDKEKVGYEVLIKIKLFMHWVVDPDDYQFKEDVDWNHKSFCNATVDKYQYDIHYLFTGVTVKQPNGILGRSFIGSVCSRYRCADSLSLEPFQVVLLAHEIGHNLGFNHQDTSHCPKDTKNLGGGFMGGGDTLNFSPCYKWELQQLFIQGKGQCLFEETSQGKTPENYVNLLSVLPTQYQSPDEQCQMLAGNDYEYYRPYDLMGDGECALFMCINLNEGSPEYMRVVKMYPSKGFTCGEEMFCKSVNECKSWNDPSIGWSTEYLREHKQPNSWSEWSNDWSQCSNECGTGVRVKRRRCLFKELFLSPHCRGPSVKVQLCNTDDCAEGPTNDNDIRKIQGDKICKRFYDNNVPLVKEEGYTYLPKARGVWFGGVEYVYVKTDTCMFHCDRSPEQPWNVLDGIYPDGTPCKESDKDKYTRQRFDIELRCVHGVCKEISDCPNNEEKDVCGVCGRDPARCVTEVVDQSTVQVEGEFVYLALLPAGTRSININMKWWLNKGVRFEIYDTNIVKIFGAGGTFSNSYYQNGDEKTYAGTEWSYNFASFVRADGPTDQDLYVIAHRGLNPIKDINVVYLLPEMQDE